MYNFIIPFAVCSIVAIGTVLYYTYRNSDKEKPYSGSSWSYAPTTSSQTDMTRRKVPFVSTGRVNRSRLLHQPCTCIVCDSKANTLFIPCLHSQFCHQHAKEYIYHFEKNMPPMDPKCPRAECRQIILQCQYWICSELNLRLYKYLFEYTKCLLFGILILYTRSVWKIK